MLEENEIDPRTAPCPRGYYLRLSITGACGYACDYCQPNGPVAHAGKILSAAHLVTLVERLTQVGVHRVRLTGGEPLTRRACTEIIERLVALPALAELSLTTNGRRLQALAPALRSAGLTRLNVHLDSLDPVRHREITGIDDHAQVLDGLDAAEAAGFAPPKLNVVVMRGVNDDEIPAFCAHAIQTGRTVRFIELMDTGVAAAWAREHRVSAEEIRERITTEYRLAPRFTERGASPAQEYGLDGGSATVGIIASESEPFCEACNRLRLSAAGLLRGCLYAAEGVDLAPLLEAGDLEGLDAAIVAGVAAKRSFHPAKDSGPEEAFSMASIGG